jgi:cobalamin biosynthesis protein CobD/CbiB
MVMVAVVVVFAARVVLAPHAVAAIVVAMVAGCAREDVRRLVSACARCCCSGEGEGGMHLRKLVSMIVMGMGWWW